MSVNEIASLGDEISVLFGDTAWQVSVIDGKRGGDVTDVRPAVCKPQSEVGVLSPFLAGDEHTDLYDGVAFDGHYACSYINAEKVGVEIITEIFFGFQYGGGYGVFESDAL